MNTRDRCEIGYEKFHAFESRLYSLSHDFRILCHIGMHNINMHSPGPGKKITRLKDMIDDYGIDVYLVVRGSSISQANVLSSVSRSNGISRTSRLAEPKACDKISPGNLVRRLAYGTGASSAIL